MTKLEEFIQRFGVAREHVTTLPFEGFKAVLERSIKRQPNIISPIAVNIELDTEFLSCELIPAGCEVFRYQRSDAEATLTEIGPFYLKMRRKC